MDPVVSVASYEDDEGIIDDVVQFVNAAFHYGHIESRDDLQPHVMQLYHVVLYEAQVLNGGHSQFLGNAQAWDFTFADARDALDSMGAAGHAQIIREMIAWVNANMAEAKKADGFENRPPYLDELDDRFYALEKTDPMGTRCAAWVRSWSDLRMVTQDDFDRFRLGKPIYRQ